MLSIPGGRQAWRSAAPAVAALAAAILSVCVGLGLFVPLGRGLLLVLIAAWFSLPGVLLGWLLYAPGQGRGMAAALVGPVWGYGFSSLVLLVLWISGVRGPALLVAPVLAGAAVIPLGLWLRGALVAPAFTSRDVVAVCLLVAMVPALVGRPFSRVGETLPDGGKAYRAYFTADFVWRMAVAAELAKGEVPPINPFYRGDRLNYYWLAHLLPAAEYREMRSRLTVEQILLANSLALDLAFILFLYGFVRQWVRSPGAVAAACIGTLLFTSFEGLERIWFLYRVHPEAPPFHLLRELNIDAVTRWFYRSLPVDGLHRLLWYQPHHAMGYALGFSPMLLLAQAREPAAARLYALSGVLLGLCLLLSSFSAIMLTAVTSLLALGYVVVHRRPGAFVPAALAGAIPLGAATAAALALGYVDRSNSEMVRVLVNPMAVTETWRALLLSFGPMLLVGTAGAVLIVRRRAWTFAPVAALIAVSFAFYFFVDLRGHQYVYVGWRAGHMLFVAFAVLVAYALQELMQLRPRLRLAAAAVVVLLALGAAPTFVIDLYNTQDITNRAQAPGFRWTLVLEPDEVEALTWLRQFTPPSAVVQVEPYTRDAETWAYLPAFAERRMAAGLPISMIPLEKYEAASARVRSIYAEQNCEAAYAQAASLGIEYLYIGAPERQAHPHFEAMVRQRPDLFQPVFRKGQVSIYYIPRG